MVPVRNWYGHVLRINDGYVKVDGLISGIGVRLRVRVEIRGAGTEIGTRTPKGTEP